jgi:hypothetical protein
MIPAWLAIPVLKRLPWRMIGYGALLAAIVGGLLWYRHSLISAGIALGEARITALYEARDAKATAAHNARITAINEAHHASELELQARLATALARPATRTIRVPVGATCPAPAEGPRNASVPEAGDPAAGFVDVDDPGYGPFRDWLLGYAAGPLAGGGADAALPDRR